jgi:serine/threonine protein kinase
MMSPVPPSTPGSFFSESLMSPAAVPRYPHSKARPTLVTMERAAACALYFEQYYDALSRKNGPAIGGGRQRRGRASDKTFEFGRVIGQGAFGVVRIAKEKSNGRIVAIKQLRKIE